MQPDQVVKCFILYAFDLKADLLMLLKQGQMSACVVLLIVKNREKFSHH